MSNPTPNLDYTPLSAPTSTQRLILDCVLTTLASKGYAQTTLGEVGRQLSMSKGVIHYHFASKELLLQEAVAYIYAIAREYMSPRITASDHAWDQIRTFIEVSCDFYQHYLMQVKALQEIRSNFRPKQYRNLAQTLYEQELHDLAAVIVTGQKAKELRNFDPDIAALTLRYALNGAAARLSLEPSYDIGHHAAELVEIFGRAFRG